MNIFLSWCGADRDVKNRVKDELSNVIGPEDEIFDSDTHIISDWTKECFEWINKSQVFVAIISEETMQGSYALNEIIRARELENRGMLNIIVFKTTDLSYTDAFGMQLNHVSDANHVSRLEGNDHGYKVLTNRVSNLLTRRKNGNPEKPFDVFRPVIAGTPLKGNSFFIKNSRTDKFIELDEAFQQSNVVFATQISGYGRRSTIREYALSKKEQYKEILVLKNFKGSIREFFLNGIDITNLNLDSFEDMAPEKVIQRKLEILGKLDESTLLIVPHLIVNEQEDRELMDELENLTCRIIFVSQNIPSFICQRFPEVPIGRMDDIYLNQLFFHYYEDMDLEDRERLTESLCEFFDSIEGHTKSVEVTAQALYDDVSIDPSKIPEILLKLSRHEKDETSDRIFDTISRLFDFAEFSEDEKKILQLAALIATEGIYRGTFFELMKQAGCTSRKAYSNLIKSHWISFDEEEESIEMDELLAEVCISRMGCDERICGVCLKQLQTDLIGTLVDMNHFRATIITYNVRRIFNLLNQNKLAALLLRYQSFLEDITFRIETSTVDGEIYQQAEEEIHSISDETGRKSLFSWLSFIKTQIRSLEMVRNACSRVDMLTLKEEIERSFVNENMRESIDNLKSTMSREDELDDRYWNLMDSVIDGLLERDLRSVLINVDLLLSFCTVNLGERFSEQYTEEQHIKWATYIVNTEELVRVVLFIPYLKESSKLQLHRSLYEFDDLFSELESVSILLEHKSSYLRSLIFAGVCDEEILEAFDDYTYYFNEGRSDINVDEADMYMSYIYNLFSMLGIFCKNNKVDEVRELLDELDMDFPYEYPKISVSAVEEVCGLADQLLGIGEIDTAKALIDNMNMYYSSIPMDELDNVQRGIVQSDFDYMKEVLATIQSEYVKDEFSDGVSEYKGYYEANADATDKRLLAEYGAIAQAAKGFDFSGYTQEEMLQKKQELAERAKLFGDWRKIAPEAFALLSEAGYRILGFRHHYVQYMGGAALADGCIAEILNGEGKTYTIILAAFLNALEGRQTMVLDTSEYLTRRNYRQMSGVLEYLGCRVKLLDEYYNERQKQAAVREEYYNCDVIYSTVKTAIFQKMNDEIDRIGNRSFRYDNVIVDEADQLMIFGGNSAYTTVYSNKSLSMTRFEANIRQLLMYWIGKYHQEGTHYQYNKGELALSHELRSIVREDIVSALKPEKDEYTDSYTEEAVWLLENGLYVFNHQTRDRNYFIKNNNVFCEDETKGEFVPASEAYAFFVRKKEQLPDLRRSSIIRKKVRRQINHIAFLADFAKVSGCTATASSMREIIKDVYGLKVVRIPANIPISREDNYPCVFKNERDKLNAVAEMVIEKQRKGQPVLIISGNITGSQKIAAELLENNVDYVLLNANNKDDDEAAVLGMAGMPGRVTISTALVNRGVDIMLGGNPEALAYMDMLQSDEKELFLKVWMDPSAADEQERKILDRFDYLKKKHQKNTLSEKEEVRKLGGLCVIVCECFSHLAVEQQARGRSGRQGDPGESHVFYSLEDDMFRQLLGNQSALLGRLMTDDMMLESKLLTKSIRAAREKVQYRQFSSLKDTIELVALRPLGRGIIEEAERIESGFYTYEELLKKHFLESRLFQTEVAEFNRGKNDLSGSKLKLLAKYLKEEKAGLFSGKKSAVSRELELALTGYNEDREYDPIPFETLSRIIATSLKEDGLAEATQSCLDEWKTISDYVNGDIKEIKKHMKVFVENRIEFTVDTTVAKLLLARFIKKGTNESQ